MNDHAYDISHLLESDSIQVEVATPRIVSAPRAVPSKPKPPGPAAAQAALAMELMQCASVHDAFVEQFMRMDATATRDSYA
ncbi:MAG TPA: hypothetical protein VN043_04575 [Rhodanobacter sp.]|nr:hypothetical protein [Rhodanobacter sp.]